MDHFCAWLGRQPTHSVPVLAYHHVSPEDHRMAVFPEVFLKQMHYLAENGYVAVTPDQLAGHVSGVSTLPKKSVLLTFDDGYLDNYVYAYPILKRFGFQATLFVVTGWLGDGSPRKPSSFIGRCLGHRECTLAVTKRGAPDDAMMRWSEVENMVDDGCFNVHSHTHTHIKYATSGLSIDEFLEINEGDLATAKAMLDARLGVKPAHLCWPYGFYNDELIATAKSMGYTALYTTKKSLKALPGSDPYKIGRVTVVDPGGSWFSEVVQGNVV